MIEYFENRAFGKYLDASRLFLYKTTRNLLHWTGDTGAFLRTTMASMRLFGVPPEEFWPYETSRYDAEPPAFCYAYGQNFQTIQFFKLDSDGLDAKGVLERIKKYLAAGVPSMFGFTVFESMRQASNDGGIPIPIPSERQEGGHAIVACGFDDSKKIRNTLRGGEETTGAFKIRNSWGSDWGEEGYGYLPYAYVLNHLAVDWWSVLKSEWVDTGQFGMA